MPTLPSAFVDRIHQQFGNESNSLLDAFGEPAKTSVLMNPFKSDLNAPFDEAKSLPWNDMGFLLNHRPSFTIDPRLHGGHYYVQESSSMVIGFVLKQLFKGQTDLNCIDLCAAPGGKSLNILNYLKGSGLLVSNEVNPLRNSILRETLCKWGSLNRLVTKRNSNDFAALRGLFDFVLVDAPCSGEGMFRKDEFAISQWSTHLVKQCASTQRSILENAWALVADGGYLAFSTCTFADEENAENSRWLFSQLNCESIQIEVPTSWELNELKDHFFGLRFLPHKVPGEGFFISVFRKKGGESSKSFKSTNPFWKSALREHRVAIDSWISLSETEHVYINSKNELSVVHISSDKTLKLLDILVRNDLVAEPGSILATVKGKDIIPEHGMAMCNLERTESLIVDISREIALAYLRRDLSDILTEKRGWLILRSEGVVLGWIKKMDNRINNYYPVDWRIRMNTG
ncbi:MAG: hypothetical protein SGI87_12435 [Flavobacteriales bacterium]|nr:hypothetical protein [Flavobacteriales bacterium]